MITFNKFITEDRKIGKIIGGEHYIHRDYENTLPDKSNLEIAKSKLSPEHLKKYNIVKHNKKENILETLAIIGINNISISLQNLKNLILIWFSNNTKSFLEYIKDYFELPQELNNDVIIDIGMNKYNVENYALDKVINELTVATEGALPNHWNNEFPVLASTRKNPPWLPIV